MFLNAIISSLLNLIILGCLPLLLIYLFQRIRGRLGFRETALRAGINLGEGKYIVYCLGFCAIILLVLYVFPPPPASLLHDGSAQKPFAGLGITFTSVTLALLYGVVKTGLPEELLFRGIIAGSLARSMPILWANLLQASLFLLPHLILLRVMPDLWPILPLIFTGALFVGWIRIKSQSIVGPWLAHATLNVSLCLYVAYVAVSDTRSLARTLLNSLQLF